MTDLVAEFTIEPFEPSSPGAHVRAAIETAEARVAAHDGTSLEVGPFGTTLTGPASVVLAIVAEVNEIAVANGATRVSLQLTVA